MYHSCYPTQCSTVLTFVIHWTDKSDTNIRIHFQFKMISASKTYEILVIKHKITSKA
jgi:hypothetical protein